MIITEPFENHINKYEKWFSDHPHAYESEKKAVNFFLKRYKGSPSIEIGVGSGLFAKPLGIEEGVDPSETMLRQASARGISVKKGTAENLSHIFTKEKKYAVVLMVTTACFLEKPSRAYQEISRILKPAGVLINAFVSKESFLGKQYRAKKDKSLFYKKAKFYTVGEITTFHTAAGLTDHKFCQTLFRDPSMMNCPDPVREGFGEGAFTVIASFKR